MAENLVSLTVNYSAGLSAGKMADRMEGRWVVSTVKALVEQKENLLGFQSDD